MEGVDNKRSNKLSTIILNADDFGCSSDIDRGIAELIRSGNINSTSVLINGGNINEGVGIIKKIMKEMPCLEIGLSVGLHFNITEGKPLTKSILRSKLVLNG
jgi:chitin disaccharide deacetylase